MVFESKVMMKFRLTYIILILLMFSFSPESVAQTTEMPAPTLTDTVLFVPPLGVLIDSALRNNALIRYRNLDINAKETNLKSQRSSWIRNFGIQADSRFGTFDNFSTNTSEGQSPSILATKSSQFNYGVGAYVKIPFYDIVNRKNQVSQAKLELNQAESMADAQRDEVRQTVIRQYNDLLLKQRLLNIKSRNLGNSRLNMEMAEEQFRNGVIPLSEFVRISEIVSNAESAYESARSEFSTTYMLMEEIVGFKFNVLNKEKNHEGN
jgi:outer membrane protein TolC